VAKPEWGTKRQCPVCGGRFYDLGKADPVICIKCEHAFEPEVLLKPRRGRPDDKPVTDIKSTTADDIDDDDDDDDDTISLEEIDEEDLDDDDAAVIAVIPDIEIDDDLDGEEDSDDKTLLETDDDDDGLDILPKPKKDD